MAETCLVCGYPVDKGKLETNSKVYTDACRVADGVEHDALPKELQALVCGQVCSDECFCNIP